MPVPEKGRRLVLESIRFREKMADDLSDGIDPIERAIIDAVLSRLASMSGTNRISLGKTNAKKLQALKKSLLDIVRSKDYVNKAQTYLDSFDELDTIIIKQISAVNDIAASKALINRVRGPSLSQFESKLLGSGLEGAVVDPLMNKISQLVTTGADYKDISKEIAGFVEGPQGIKRYVSQISVDTVNQYAGQIQEAIRVENGLSWYVYSGSIIDTSRPQCRRWVDKRYIHYTELTGEIRWANNQGKGMINPTTPASFAINRGGYNCRHDAIVVSDEIVPADIRALHS
jgi:hypothetical protein